MVIDIFKLLHFLICVFTACSYSIDGQLYEEKEPVYSVLWFFPGALHLVLT